MQMADSLDKGRGRRTNGNEVGERTTEEGFVTKNRWPIHRPAPAFVSLSTKQEILETGIKVIDLLAPILKGGKV